MGVLADCGTEINDEVVFQSRSGVAFPEQFDQKEAALRGGPYRLLKLAHGL
jgi:hypothetical protein